MSDIFIFIIVRNKNKTIKIKPDEVINKYLDSWMISTKYGLFVVNTTKKSFIFVNNVYEINEGKAIEIKFIEDKDRSYGLFNEILKKPF